jgi:magnesium and cobalt exporter, CNNM family
MVLGLVAAEAADPPSVTVATSSMIAVLGLVAINGFFVAAEFSLVTVDRGRLRQLAESGDRGARGIQAAVRKLSFQLSGAQLGITITSLLLGVLAEPAIAHLLAPGVGEAVAVALALALATVAQMVLGELVPKNAALARPLQVARLSVPPQRVFSALFGPLIRAFNGAANAMVRALGAQPQEELASARSPEELSLLLRLSADAGTLPPSTAAMLHRALRFTEKTAAEAMTPRTDCVTAPSSGTVADLLALARRTGHLRYPVQGPDLDDIAGTASVVDALGVPAGARESTPLSSITRPPVLVPESLDLTLLLPRLRDAGAELAVVVDEYGGFAGIVSYEDLAEEIVGELADEYDTADAESGEPAPRRLQPGGTASVPAGLRTDELEERTGFAMPDGPYETLAGLILDRLGRLPEVGDEVAVNGWTLRVTGMQPHRIERVELTAPTEMADR